MIAVAQRRHQRLPRTMGWWALTTAQLGVVQRNWGRREVTSITRGSHPQPGTLQGLTVCSTAHAIGNLKTKTISTTPSLIGAISSRFVTVRGFFYWHGLTLIPAWIRNNMPSKILYEITNPFQHFNSFHRSVQKWMKISISDFIMDEISYPCLDKSWTMLVKGVLGVSNKQTNYQFD